MYSKQQFCNLFSRIASLAIVLALAAVPALAQSAVPPTAREAASMQQFASHLHSTTPPANGQSPAPATGRTRMPLPQGQVIYSDGTTDAWTANFGRDNGNGCFPEQQGLFKVIHDFTIQEGVPYGVTADKAGNLYGATEASTVFKLAPHDAGWVLNSLYTLAGGSDGSISLGFAISQNGTLYSTSNGGIQGCAYNGGAYCGQVYTLRTSPTACRTSFCSWTEKVLYRFTGNNDAWFNTYDFYIDYQGPLVFDKAGNLYGTSIYGGAQQGGAVYQLQPSSGAWTENILHSFVLGSTDWGPTELLVGNDGNLYGETAAVFQLVPSASGWTENVLYEFNYYAVPPYFLVQDSAGNLYGKALSEDQRRYEIFRLSPSNGNWVFTVLFLDDIAYDYGFVNLTIDVAGDLYFTGIGCVPSDGLCEYPFGHIDKLLHGSWEHQVLAYFENSSFRSTGALALDAEGNLYGTTRNCGEYNNGTVWQLTPQ